MPGAARWSAVPRREGLLELRDAASTGPSVSSTSRVKRIEPHQIVGMLLEQFAQGDLGAHRSV